MNEQLLKLKHRVAQLEALNRALEEQLAAFMDYVCERFDELDGEKLAELTIGLKEPLSAGRTLPFGTEPKRNGFRPGA